MPEPATKHPASIPLSASLQAASPLQTASPAGSIPPAGSNPAGGNPAGGNPAGRNPAGRSPAGGNPAGCNPASIPDLWDQLFAQALKMQANSDDLPQAENLQEESGLGIYVTDAEVLAARNSASVMGQLWERMEPLVRGMVHITLRHHRHTSKEDLEQEAWIVFAQSVERYDGRSRGAFWTYLRLSLHTRFRQFAAHDRVIPIPHDTRSQRQSWHKITRATFDARLQAQNLSYPDADTDGWSIIATEGENSMENAVIEEMDQDIMCHKLQCLPRRWRDLLMLSQEYKDPDLALLLAIEEADLVSLRDRIMSILHDLPSADYVRGKSEDEYIADWKRPRK